MCVASLSFFCKSRRGLKPVGTKQYFRKHKPQVFLARG